MIYQKFYFIDLWDMISILKKDVDSNHKICFFSERRGYKHFYRWKCHESKIIYELHHNLGYFWESVPDIFDESLERTDLKDLKSWIKENSKGIDSLNKLKAFI